MMLVTKIQMISLTMLILLAACGSKEDAEDIPKKETITIKNEKPLPPQTSLTCPTGTLNNYDNFGKGFFRNYCTSCHSRDLKGTARAGAPAAVNLDSLNEASLWRSAIQRTTLSNRATMPPSLNITPLDKEIFTEWFNCGMPRD